MWERRKFYKVDVSLKYLGIKSVSNQAGKREEIFCEEKNCIN